MTAVADRDSASSSARPGKAPGPEAAKEVSRRTGIAAAANDAEEASPAVKAPSAAKGTVAPARIDVEATAEAAAVVEAETLAAKGLTAADASDFSTVGRAVDLSAVGEMTPATMTGILASAKSAVEEEASAAAVEPSAAEESKDAANGLSIVAEKTAAAPEELAEVKLAGATEGSEAAERAAAAEEATVNSDGSLAPRLLGPSSAAPCFGFPRTVNAASSSSIVGASVFAATLEPPTTAVAPATAKWVSAAVKGSRRASTTIAQDCAAAIGVSAAAERVSPAAKEAAVAAGFVPSAIFGVEATGSVDLESTSEVPVFLEAESGVAEGLSAADASDFAAAAEASRRAVDSVATGETTPAAATGASALARSVATEDASTPAIFDCAVAEAAGTASRCFAGTAPKEAAGIELAGASDSFRATEGAGEAEAASAGIAGCNVACDGEFEVANGGFGGVGGGVVAEEASAPAAA